MILRIVSVNANWLQFCTHDIDNRLGFFQNNFSLSGDEVRALAVKQPKIITYSLSQIKVNIFVVKEEMGFNPDETKAILLKRPKIFMSSQYKLLKTFEYLHKTMQIPLEDIVKLPGSLSCREHRLKERYLFLKKLNRVQFDSKKPNYVSLLSIVSGSDSHFATEIAKSSIQAYNEFLKTL
ncbi:hypothetical protein HHI36_004201 [Cryptolaemus montrouzieri]|uniref:Uncharacterized protein n=1 Tax=Cryptolaemus montrouzieri TaxID=559131 RepID=A0ABD2NRG7_9CUCU